MEEQKNQQNKKQQGKHLKKCNIKIDLTKKMGLDIPKENKYVIPIFIPHRGCKNECVFCNQRKISGEQRLVTPDDVREEIKSWLKSLNDKSKMVQVAFFGGSFTGLDLEEQEAFLKVANEFIESGAIKSVKVSTRPDYINTSVLDLLKRYNVDCIELGVQSLDDEVLIASKRGHTAAHVISASKLIHEYGFKLGHQVMIGLPKSTQDKEVYTIKNCLKLKPDVIRIYPVYVLKESNLYDMALTQEYIPLTLAEAITRTKKVYSECVKKHVNVIRIGLQTTDEINEKSEDILGPVCDNYREKILGEIAKEELVKKIKNLKCNTIILNVPLKTKNYVIGNKRENIVYLEKKTGSKILVESNN